MGPRFYQYVCLVMVPAAVFAAYVVPDESQVATIPSPLPAPICPDGCVCDTDLKTTECHLSYSHYNINKLLPWQLLKLKLTGSGSTLKNPTQFSTLRTVLHGLDGIDRTDDFQKVFSSAEYLELHYFPITTLTDTDLIDLSSLRTLNLAFNNISNIPPNNFQHQTQLKQLNLAGNKIKELVDDMFLGMNQLTSLYLESNGLQFISVAAFRGLDSLKFLYLQNNNIRYVDKFVPGLPRLSLINLEGNKITYILNSSLTLMKNYKEVKIGFNPFECSCIVKELVQSLHPTNTSFLSRDVTCAKPEFLIGVKLSTLDMTILPCDSPMVTTVSEYIDIAFQSSLSVSCAANGTSPLGVYWITPWGDLFASSHVQHTFPQQLDGAVSDKIMEGINLPMRSRVFITPDNFLHFENFRGFFRGTYTCVALGYMGVSNSTVEISMYTKMEEIYIESIFICVYCTCTMLSLAIIIGSIRWFVHKCLHSEGCHCCCCRCDDISISDEKSEKSDPIEVIYEPSEVYATGNESEDPDPDNDSLPPCPPVNSPQERLSPSKCTTPYELTDPSKEPPHIWEQLDEVRARLRYGAEKKMERVRSHVRSITDTGSLKIRNIKDAGTMKIQSIKETGSNAASRVKKNVASGMVQVKYGVQSIKEFCGTGEMGTGTVSMVSVSTDVDSREQIKIVKSHTFV